MRALICIALATLSGCATLERHPIATAIGTGFLIGSIAASSHHTDHHDVATPSVSCANEACK